jgi:3-hydroxy-9,10-secoandrosta-1,3,5(10)-triene-9,17-dione monooxygenase reductase component
MTHPTPDTAAAPAAFDAKAFRAALGSFATGVTVITARAADGTPVGLTANSFNSVSLDPPMVLWSLARKALSLPVFMEAAHWAVHILAADQEDLSNRFARSGADKFAGLPTDTSAHGVPLLQGCVARFECATSFRYEGGDHVILVGEVVSFERTPRAPLVFHAGRYAHATAKQPDGATRSVEGFSEDLLGYLLGRAHHQFHATVRPVWRAAGLSDAAWSVVAALLVRDGQSVGELARALAHVVEGDVAPVLQRLQADGDWLEVDAGAGESELRFRLSPGGRDRVLRLLAVSKAREADLVAQFGSEDAVALKSLLLRFCKLAGAGLPDLWAGAAGAGDAEGHAHGNAHGSARG